MSTPAQEFRNALRDLFLLGFETEALINLEIQEGALFSAQRRSDRLNEIKIAAQNALKFVKTEEIGLLNAEEMNRLFERFSKIYEEATKD